ncbi:MAG: DNA replication and repair protein RecF [Ignavibacteriae bacterium]|nr:MAG: DNA replication and repair protein RecF [Ignavibacteriota bacterium]
MVLNYIDLTNFRLHGKTNIEFSKNINYIVGGNGQGKTSLLEGIYYLCTTKNLSRTSDSEAVKFDNSFFEITGSFTEYTKNKVRIYYDSNASKKNIFLDDKQIYKTSELIGKFPVVALLQSDHEITKGSPSVRRRFIDSIISQASSTYLKLILDYNKILRNRSTLLSNIKERYEKSLVEQLEAWTTSLISTGTEIIKHRKNFIEELNDYVKKPYEQIMGKSESPKIKYQASIGNVAESVRETFTQKLNNSKKDELRIGRNLVGPHRDDFDFTIDNLELKKYGSQGQNKTFQIALRFTQFFYLKDKLKITPIFLMDDVFGELDSARAKKISDYLKEIGQAFITMTDFSRLEKLHKTDNDLILNVKSGNVTYV